MNYYESAEGMTISKARAMFELVKHTTESGQAFSTKSFLNYFLFKA